MSKEEIPTIVGNSGEGGFVPLEPKGGYGASRTVDLTVAAKASYVSIARHDLLAPVRRIVNLADFLSEDLGSVPVEESRDHVQKIRTQARELTILLDDLDRYERAHICESPELLPLGYMFDAAIAEAEIPAGVTVLLDASQLNDENLDGTQEGLPPIDDRGEHDLDTVEIFGERRALFGCLVELLNNAAIHRRAPFGSIRIVVSRTQTAVHIMVEDDGIGIDAEHREIIFEPLRKIHHDETISGNGMGLAIVKRTTESRGGSIELVHSTSHGSSFRLTLPSAP